MDHFDSDCFADLIDPELVVRETLMRTERSIFDKDYIRDEDLMALEY